MEDEQQEKVENLNHHKRFNYCTTRLKYRKSNQLTAVKVYSITSESCHLLVFGVPKINLMNEVKTKFKRFGSLKTIEIVTDQLCKQKFEIEQFTECYHIKFEKIQQARRAKKFLDARNFYGGILHISYAPEYESVDELREKLQQRVTDVSSKFVYK